jgi:dCMP deaminase
MDKWDVRSVRLAKEVATWSKCEVKVGAVIVSGDRRKFSPGYNGYPRNIDDSLRMPEDSKELDVHAELNAILNCGFDLFGTTLYVTKAPCIECAKAIIQSQITRVVCANLDISSSWHDKQKRAYELLVRAGKSVEFFEVNDEQFKHSD